MTISSNVFLNFHAHQQKPGADEIVIQSLFLQENLIVQPNDKIFFTAGLHPWHAEQLTKSEIEFRLENLISKKQIIAVGETGLDKIRGANWQTQIDVFKTHVGIAEKHKMPLIIHSVKSHNEILKLRIDLKAKVPWVIHLFNGSKQMALDLIAHGCYLSIGHHISNTNSRIGEYFSEIPIQKLFLETDDFDVDIKTLYSVAAEKREFSIEDLKKQIINNYKSIFNE